MGNFDLRIKLTGGLGNQLFGMAALIALRKELKCKASVDSTNFKRIQIKRHLEVEPILYDQKIEIVDEEHQNNFYEVNPFRYDPRVLKIRKNTTLNGYFQSQYYFSNYSEEIRSILLRSFLGRSKLVSKPGISLHARRGDYVHSDYHGLCSLNYYKSAVRILRSIWGNLPVYIFSDDESFAPKITRQISNSIIFNKRLTPIDTLIAMSQNSCLVASNSSFSFWAGFLSMKTYGRIILPEQWTNFENAEELILPEWITIDREMGSNFNFSMRNS
jgi:hypothetical protein